MQIKRTCVAAAIFCTLWSGVCLAQPNAAPPVSDTGFVLLLSEPQSLTAGKIATNAEVQTALVALMGYQTGSYSKANVPAVFQVLDAMARKRKNEDLLLEDGRHIVSSRSFNGKGENRAALLIDKGGQLQAAALVHGVCREDAELKTMVCDQIPHAILTIFLGKGISQEQVQPLVSWGKTLPEDLVFDAKYHREDGQWPQAWEVTAVNFVQPDVKQPSWSIKDLPKSFPQDFSALMLPDAYVKMLATNGQYVYPPLLEGFTDTGDIRIGYDDKTDPAMADATLFRVGNLKDTLAAYQQLLPQAALSQQTDDAATLQGQAHGYRYRIILQANQVTGDYGLDEAIEARVLGWKIK